MATQRTTRRLAIAMLSTIVVFAAVGCLAAGPTPAATVPATAAGPELIFLAADLRIEAGQCTALEWESQGLVRVYLDGRGVEPSGSIEVCPESTTKYVLSGAAGDGTQIEREVTIEVPATVEPPTPTPAPSETPEPTARPRPVASPTVAATPTPTAVPTSAVSVEFYPNNYVDSIPATDLCTSVKWRTSGVTNLELQRDDGGRKPVGPTGSEEACFQGAKVKFVLYYQLPDGRIESREIVIKRQG